MDGDVGKDGESRTSGQSQRASERKVKGRQRTAQNAPRTRCPSVFRFRCCEWCSVSVAGARELGKETHLEDRPKSKRACAIGWLCGDGQACGSIQQPKHAPSISCESLPAVGGRRVSLGEGDVGERVTSADGGLLGQSWR